MKKQTKRAKAPKTPAEMRVQIAKDVLKQIEAKKLIPMVGAYLLTPMLNEATFERSDELRDVLKKKTCTVCAIGAVFMAALDRYDELSVEDAGLRPREGTSESTINIGSLFDYAQRWFARDQLKVMEYVFEHGLVGHFDGRNDTYDACKAMWTGTTDEECLTKIMKNIVRNKGVFDPKKEPRRDSLA